MTVDELDKLPNLRNALISRLPSATHPKLANLCFQRFQAWQAAQERRLVEEILVWDDAQTADTYGPVYAYLTVSTFKIILETRPDIREEYILNQMLEGK